MARVWCLSVCLAVMVVVVSAGGGGGSEGGQDEAPRPRRAPSGFLGMRGKKEAPSPPLQDDSAPSPPQDFLPSLYQLNLPLRGKKAPSGFLGMRGKKSQEEEEEDSVFESSPFDSEIDMMLKRTPSGFLGMRGKKTPSGFLGMRGKKNFEEYYPYPSQQALLSLLKGGAAPRDDDYYYYYNPEGWYDGGVNKRAPSGFLGMRGKRDYPPFPTQDKRTPSGFLGMRG